MKTNLIDDHILGTFLRIAFGALKPYKGKVHIVTHHAVTTERVLEQLSLVMTGAVYGREKLFTTKTTTTPITIGVLEGIAKNLWQNANSTRRTRPYAELKKQAESVESLAKYLGQKYNNDTNIDYDDIRKIYIYPEAVKTLQDHFIVTEEQLLELKKFVKKYHSSYIKRELEGQERLKLPNKYIEPILEYISSPSLMEEYGTQKIPITSHNKELFCHSLMCLHYEGKITLRGLRDMPTPDGHRYWEAIIDINHGSDSPLKKLPLPKDCYWKQTVFHCGDKQVDFYDTKTAKYFQLLTDKMGLPVYNKDIFKDFGYNKSDQIANGVKKDVASRLDREGLLKTKGRPKGRVSITPISKEPNLIDKHAGYICRIE